MSDFNDFSIALFRCADDTESVTWWFLDENGEEDCVTVSVHGAFDRRCWAPPEIRGSKILRAVYDHDCAGGCGTDRKVVMFV